MLSIDNYHSAEEVERGSTWLGTVCREGDGDGLARKWYGFQTPTSYCDNISINATCSCQSECWSLLY